jgi:branched-subunit amino acid transport protein
MNIWIAMILGGLITFGMRFSFIFLFGRFEIPETLRRALRFVPPAVFSAIVFPEVFLQNNHLELSLGNHRLLAGLIAVIVAQMTKNTLITILTGMAVLVMLQVFFQ